MLVKKNGKNKVVVIGLTKNGSKTYDVIPALIARPGYPGKGAKRLWPPRQ